MLAMPFPGVLMPRLAGGANPADAPFEGLQTLLSGFDGSDAAFSAELQSLLLSLTPHALQRLESLVTGGMELPQAARQMLAESPLPLDLRTGGMLPEWTAGLQRASTRSPQALPAPGNLVSALGSLALPAVSSGLETASPLPIGGLNGLGSTGMSPSSSLMSPQLTHSLLDMGIPQAVGSKGWPGAVAERVLWMAQGEQQFAKLTLNPPHLGPLEVRVAINQDQTSVTFLASHAAVREVLEAAMPRLRDLFDQQSMTLVHAEVADPGARQDDARSAGSQGRPDGGSATADTGLDGHEDMAAASPVIMARGLVDLFA